MPRFLGSNERLIVCSVPGSSFPLEGTALKLATFEKQKSKGRSSFLFVTVS